MVRVTPAWIEGPHQIGLRFTPQGAEPGPADPPDVGSE
jgi:hypothetical protein